MLVRDKKHFTLGIAMAVSFFVLLFVILAPIFGDGRNGLEFSDDIFNKLSKGSAYFIPKIAKNNERLLGKQFSATIKIDKPEDAQRVAGLLSSAGAKVEQKEGTLKIEGDLGAMLAAAARDADFMYKNNGEKVKSAYGYDEKKVMKDWWTALSKMDKAFQSTKDFENSRVVAELNKKVVEPSYNYYGIQAQKVTERAGTMIGLLSFYVIYTMWWGYALYNLFEGIGLTTKKVTVKKEL